MTITIADGRGALWQWDTGRRLRVGSGVDQIHYQNRALGGTVDVDVGTDGTAIIPYSGNMTLEAGKYYSQSGKTYLCNRDTGNPVYNALADLVGIYVTEV